MIPRLLTRIALGALLISLAGGCQLIFPYSTPGAEDGGLPGADAVTEAGTPFPDAGGGPGPAEPCQMTPGAALWRVDEVAGDGTAGSLDGEHDEARLDQPRSICWRGDTRTLYIAQAGDGRLRRWRSDDVETLMHSKDASLSVPRAAAITCPATGDSLIVATPEQHKLFWVYMPTPISSYWYTRTWSGTGAAGADNGKNPSYNAPHAAAYDGKIRYYVADSGNHVIRWLDRILDLKNEAGTAAGELGLGAGFRDGVTTSARFNAPADLAWDAKNSRLIIADRGNHRVRVYDPAANTVDTLAGSGQPGCRDGAGQAARFNWPSAVAVDASGVVYVADTGSNALRRIDAGKVTTIAGNGLAGRESGDTAPPQLSGPFGVAVKDSDRVFVADTGNHRVLELRK